MSVFFNPLVSIIIPIYNGSNYMKEAIDSAIAQSYKNIEIIVVNDGSTDNGETENIAKGYGDKIRYIRKDNGGVSTALNVGIKNMRGTYFSWLSHDDVYTPDKIEKAIRALSSIVDKETLVYCNSIYIDKHSEQIKGISSKRKVTSVIKVESWNDTLMSLLSEGTMNGCSFLIHKNVFEKCGLFDERLRFNQDGFMWNKIFIQGFSLLRIPDVCVKTRLHENQVMQTRQDLFKCDCERMSEYLIPELIKISTKERNFIFEYIKYNAKYDNKNVVKNAYDMSKKEELVNIWSSFEILVWCMYGTIRPVIKKIYYKFFRGIKTT